MIFGIWDLSSFKISWFLNLPTKKVSFCESVLLTKKADNRVLSLSRIGWLNFSDQFYYYNCLNLKKHEMLERLDQKLPKGG